ncbi:MAG: hypothetical protein FJX63_07930 [Alphaproteobacteria bacterium]|nr:hypothetical protein [Alphaproteobacteria bacterium]
MLMGRNELLEVNLTAAPASLAAGWSALAQRALVPAGLNAPKLLLPQLDLSAKTSLATVSAGGDLLLAMPLLPRRPGLLASPRHAAAALGASPCRW